MCGRFVQYSDPGIYASRYAIDTLCPAQPSYNLAPTQLVLAIRQTEAGRRTLAPLRWGLIPSWSKGPDPRYRMINARAETLNAKPAYRTAFRHRRCLIPAEGFYEWRTIKTGKQAYLICRRDRAPFAMAGLWETWGGSEGATIESCTLIVTDANPLIRPIHDRMPVILPPEGIAAWLDPANRDTGGLTAFLRPAPADDWTLIPVSRLVDNARNDGPEPIAPVAGEVPPMLADPDDRERALDASAAGQDNGDLSSARSSVG